MDYTTEYDEFYVSIKKAPDGKWTARARGEDTQFEYDANESLSALLTEIPKRIPKTSEYQISITHEFVPDAKKHLGWAMEAWVRPYRKGYEIVLRVSNHNLAVGNLTFDALSKQTVKVKSLEEAFKLVEETSKTPGAMDYLSSL